LYLSFGLVVALSWSNEALAAALPHALTNRIYPIDKSDLDPLRLMHFLALAVVVSSLPQAWWRSEGRVAKALIRCGENSLDVYCYGVLLCLLAQGMLLKVSSGIEMQMFVSLTAMALLIAFGTVSTLVSIGSSNRARLL
jgi:hypothetical protein